MPPEYRQRAGLPAALLFLKLRYRINRPFHRTVSPHTVTPEPTRAGYFGLADPSLSFLTSTPEATPGILLPFCLGAAATLYGTLVQMPDCASQSARSTDVRDAIAQSIQK